MQKHGRAWVTCASARKDPRQASDQYDKALALKPDLLYTLLNAGQVADKLDGRSRRKSFTGVPSRSIRGWAEAANGWVWHWRSRGKPKRRAILRAGHRLAARFLRSDQTILRLYIQQGKTGRCDCRPLNTAPRGRTTIYFT